MKSSRARRSRGPLRDHPGQSPDHEQASRAQRVAVGREAAKALAAREGSVVAREAAAGRREDALATERAFDARVRAEQSRADAERLISQMREANERLIVAVVQAQNVSDEAHAEGVQAKADLEQLMHQLQDAHERLTAANTQAHAMAEEASRREEEYRRLSSRLLELQDEERRRLALDLHDSTAQRLAALTMNLDLVGGAQAVLDARSRRALAESRSLAEQCSHEVRTLAYLLHPPMLDEMGLLSAVRWYVAGFIERSGIRVELDLQAVGRWPGSIETALFRVVQESLTNVHRHASTSTASIRLTSTADEVVLDIEDQGHGVRDLSLQRDALPPEVLGVGIQGMRERIRQLGGALDVRFTDTGTTVRVHLPLKIDTA
jgi:signal transduction histidine kinase